jgi:hypothetical protein
MDYVSIGGFALNYIVANVSQNEIVFSNSHWQVSKLSRSQYYLLLLTPLRPIKTSCRSGNDVAWGDEVCDCDDDVIVGTSVDDCRPEVAVAIAFSAFFENCRKKATARDLKKGFIILLLKWMGFGLNFRLFSFSLIVFLYLMLLSDFNIMIILNQALIQIWSKYLWCSRIQTFVLWNISHNH